MSQHPERLHPASSVFGPALAIGAALGDSMLCHAVSCCVMCSIGGSHQHG